MVLINGVVSRHFELLLPCVFSDVSVVERLVFGLRGPTLVQQIFIEPESSSAVQMLESIPASFRSKMLVAVMRGSGASVGLALLCLWLVLSR